MPNMSELLAQIKNAIYGKDVRDAIHDSIEECYNIAIGETHSVRYDEIQNLNENQKNTARNNINAAKSNDLDDVKNILKHGIALEQGAYGSESGSVPSNYRIRLKTPFQVEKGTIIHFYDGSLYHMIWELSSQSTSGGNVITFKGFNNEETYFVRNNCYIMLSFSKTESGATSTITVNDFVDYYSVIIEKPKKLHSASTVMDVSQEAKMLQELNFNLLDTNELVEGCYKHSDPYSIMSGLNTKIIPGIRIYAGISYLFKNVYGYFCPIVYDDGTIENLSDSSSPATITSRLVPAKNGYAYITINNGYYDTAMVVQGTGPNSQGKFDGFSGAIKSLNYTIGPGNYQNILPDWKTAPANSIFSIVSTTSMVGNGAGLWNDVPLPLYHKQCELTFETIGNTSSVGCVQICNIANMGLSFIRYLNANNNGVYWTGWYQCGKNHNSRIIIDKSGNGDFNSFTEGILYATQFMDSVVYVMPGTYDILTEYTNLYGNSFIEDYDSSNTNRGIVLKNNVVIEFAPNAYITCVYTGNNTIFQNYFSPLNSGEHGFTLINCHVTSRNVRYSMHDERNLDTDYYHNKYIGCHFIHDKGTGAGYRQTIGGGLGKNGLIEIENCIFENPTLTEKILSWHNCRLSGARSQIFIRNSIVKGSVRFSYYGESELVSTMMITGCKMYYEPIITQETSAYNIENVEILKWNNIIEAPSN